MILLKHIRAFANDESGQDLLEYALLVALIALVAVGVGLGEADQGALDVIAAAEVARDRRTLARSRVGTRERLRAAYTAAGGADVSAEELRFWEVFGNVRWGVICILQAGVHLSGERPSLELAAIGRRTCEPEWDLLAMLG